MPGHELPRRDRPQVKEDSALTVGQTTKGQVASANPRTLLAGSRAGHDLSRVPIRRRPQLAERPTPRQAGVKDNAVRRALEDRSPGCPLEESHRDLGGEFHDVRIHTDDAAAALAADVEANAFTRGRDIYFGRGMYRPGSRAGNELLRHELVHVLQQEAGEISGFAGRVVPPAHPSEFDARSRPALSQQRSLKRVPDFGVQRGAIQRQPKGEGAPPGPTAAEEEAMEGRLRLLEPSRRGPWGQVGPGVLLPEAAQSARPLLPFVPFLKAVIFTAGGVVAVAILLPIAAEVAVPALISEAGIAAEAVESALAAYYANALVVNEIGVFAVGMILSCEGDVAGLLDAAARDPRLLLQILTDVYLLHLQIRIAGAPPRPATIPAKILPPDQQTDPERVQFRIVRPPEVEDTRLGKPASTPKKFATVPETGTRGSREVSSEKIARREGMHPWPLLSPQQQAFADELVTQHPQAGGLHPRVAAEAAVGAIGNAPRNTPGGDIILAGGKRREVSVYAGRFDHKHLADKLIEEAGQGQELYIQVNSPDASRTALLEIMPTLRRSWIDLNGVFVKFFGPDGKAWWSGEFRFDSTE